MHGLCHAVIALARHDGLIGHEHIAFTPPFVALSMRGEYLTCVRSVGGRGMEGKNWGRLLMFAWENAEWESWQSEGNVDIEGSTPRGRMQLPRIWYPCPFTDHSGFFLNSSSSSIERLSYLYLQLNSKRFQGRHSKLDIHCLSVRFTLRQRSSNF